MNRSVDEQPAPPQRLLLVHGLWMGPWCWRWLRRHLADADVAIDTFAYRTGEAPEQIAERLAGELADRDIDTMLVGHSLGGLLSLMSLQHGRDLPVQRLLLLGSPVHGSVAARGMLRWPLLPALLGAQRDLLCQGLPQACWPAHIDVGLVVGTRAIGGGRLFGARGGDGTVEIDETTLADGLPTCRLPVSHSTMLSSPRTARAVLDFWRQGHFGDSE